jgi:hypothetical protein
MSSWKQIAANRRNALKSTGPTTEQGKLRSRCNAVRHGLTAETVISALEDADDYKAFESSVTADYDAHSTVERELVLRLASLLWRLRRATAMETGLLDIQANQLGCFKHTDQQRASDEGSPAVGAVNVNRESTANEAALKAIRALASKASNPTYDLARCFLRLANLPTYPLDRLSRYEAILWRQTAQTLLALDALDRRKPNERKPWRVFDEEL